MIVDKINAYLNTAGKTIDEIILADVAVSARYSFMRQFGEVQERTNTLRLSSIGRCVRQQAYNVLGFEQNGKTIDARAKMVFFQGDIVELAIVQLAKAAGCDIMGIGMSQSRVEIDGIVGHPDGLLRDSGTNYLLEVKSMSSYGFKEFERGVIDDGYRFQVNAYMEALALEKVLMVAYNKDAGLIAEKIISKDPDIVKDIQNRIKIIKAATKDKLPKRPYAPNDKGFYPWNCLYCGFHGTCLPNAEKVLVGKAYKLKEKKEIKNETTQTGNEVRASSSL